MCVHTYACGPQSAKVERESPLLKKPPQAEASSGPKEMVLDPKVPCLPPPHPTEKHCTGSGGRESVAALLPVDLRPVPS